MGCFEESNRDERRKLLPGTPGRREAARVERVLGRIVRERPSQDVAHRWVRETLAGLWLSADPQRREALARSTAAADALSATIPARPEQRRRLHQRLRDFADDFSVLAAR